jgi:hypothetical protein
VGRDDERDRYRGDVWYEEWRRGLAEGAISDDRIAEGFDNGEDPFRLVDRVVTRRIERDREREFEQQQCFDHEYPEDPEGNV